MKHIYCPFHLTSITPLLQLSLNLLLRHFNHVSSYDNKGCVKVIPNTLIKLLLRKMIHRIINNPENKDYQECIMSLAFRQHKKSDNCSDKERRHQKPIYSVFKMLDSTHPFVFTTIQNPISYQIIAAGNIFDIY